MVEDRVLLIFEHPGLLGVALQTRDLLVQASQLSCVRVDLIDRLAHLLIKPSLNGAQLLPGLLERRSQVLCRRDYGLTGRNIRGIVSKLLEATEELVNDVAEPATRGIIEKGLDLIHRVHIRVELVLLLGFLVYAKFQDIVADALDPLEIHPIANRNLPCIQRGGLSQNGDLPGVTGRIDIGDVIRSSINSAFLGKKRAHCNRKAAE